MSDKKTKSVQVRLTENEWLLLKKLTNNKPSEYLRQLWLKKLNKKLKITLIYTCYSTEPLIGEILKRFNENYSNNFPELTNPDNITARQSKNGKIRITWSGKIHKHLLPKLERMEHHAEPLYDNLPIEHSHIEVRYRKESL